MLTNTLEAVSPVELVFTAEQSWAETTLDNLSGGEANIQFDENADRQGPITLAASAENFTTEARVVVFGDSDFALDVNFIYFANGDLIVNSVDWTAGQEDLINLTPKENTQRMLLPPQNAMMKSTPAGFGCRHPGSGACGWHLCVHPETAENVALIIRRSTLILLAIFALLLAGAVYLQRSGKTLKAEATPTEIEPAPVLIQFTNRKLSSGTSG